MRLVLPVLLSSLLLPLLAAGCADSVGQEEKDGGAAEGEGEGAEGEVDSITRSLGQPSDALASYLMDPAAGAWNLFGGASVPLGRREDPLSGTGVSYHTALRFSALPLPPGAEILTATVRWWPTNEVDSNHPLLLNVWAEAADDSTPLDPTSYERGRPDQRLRSLAFVERMVVRCNRDCEGTGPDDCECLPVWDYACWQRVQDCWDRDRPYDFPKELATLVQETVDRPGWNAGGAITFLFVNAAGDAEEFARYRESRSITAWDEQQPARRPQLTVTYRQP